MGGRKAGEGSQPVYPPGPTVMGILSSWNMRNLLANASLKLETEKKAELSKIHQSTVHGAQAEIVSAVNLVFLSNTNTEKLDSPVTFAFSHRVNPQVGRNQPDCSPLNQGHSSSYAAFISPLCSFLKQTSGLWPPLLYPLSGTQFSLTWLSPLPGSSLWNSSFRPSLICLFKIIISSYAPPALCCFLLISIAPSPF